MKKIILLVIFVIATITLLLVFQPQGDKHDKTVLSPTISPTRGQPANQTDDAIIFGKIAKIEGRHILVTSDKQDYDIVLSDYTFFKKGKKQDLAVGKQLAIIANPDEDGTHIARTIILPASSSGDLRR